MNATLDRSPFVFAGQAGQKLLSIGEASLFAGCHENTLRLATDSGRLRCLRLGTGDRGHRRFSIPDLLAWLGQDKQGESGSDPSQKVPIAAVVRCSTSKQAQGENGNPSQLENQTERVRNFINEKWGGAAAVTWYSRVASGLNFENPVFLSLIEDILAGKFRGGYLVASTFDRVCRFGIRLVEHICKLGGCEIVYVLANEAETEAESLTDDVLAILCHFTAKQNGNKVKKLSKVTLDETSLREAWQLQQAGWSLRKIAAHFASEGRKDPKGRPYTATVIYKNLSANRRVLENTVETDRNSLDAFIDLRLRKAKGKQLEFRAFKAAYEGFCEAEGLSPIIDKNKVARGLRRRGYKVEYDWHVNRRVIEGCFLK